MREIGVGQIVDRMKELYSGPPRWIELILWPFILFAAFTIPFIVCYVVMMLR